MNLKEDFSSLLNGIFSGQTAHKYLRLSWICFYYQQYQHQV